MNVAGGRGRSHEDNNVEMAKTGPDRSFRSDRDFYRTEDRDL